MATTKQVTETLGNIPAVRGTIYADNKNKPDVKAGEGQRISWLRFKTIKDTKANTETLRKPICVLLNQVTPSNIIHQNEKGTEFLQALVNEFQDSQCKLAADSKLAFDRVESIDALIADYFDSSRASGITKEIVGTFFDAKMAEWLVARIVAKFQNMESDKVAKVVEQYRNSFCDLARYQMPHTKAVFELVSKAHKEFTYAEEDAEMQEWIGERLQKLNDKFNANEMLIDAI